jgi:hypothetical protein
MVRALVRQDTTEGGGERSVPLPQFAVDALHRSGTLREPDNFGTQCAKSVNRSGCRTCLRTVPQDCGHALDDSGLSAADQLGHARPSALMNEVLGHAIAHDRSRSDSSPSL